MSECVFDVGLTSTPPIAVTSTVLTVSCLHETTSSEHREHTKQPQTCLPYFSRKVHPLYQRQMNKVTLASSLLFCPAEEIEQWWSVIAGS